jgi:hypothetical protein
MSYLHRITVIPSSVSSRVPSSVPTGYISGCLNGIVIFIVILLLFVHSKINLIRYYKISNIEENLLYEQLDIYLKKPIHKNKVVISLTTIPSRISSLYKTIYSLLDQTYRVDEIVLNIPYISTKGVTYDIPNWIKICITYPFIRLHRCDDIGPITKLVPTIDYYKDQNVTIIVVDDDTIYKEDLVSKLVYHYQKYKCAISSTGYKFFNINGPERIYNNIANMKHVDVLMGYNGYIVHTSFFKKDWNLFRQSNPLFFYVDDDCISIYLNQQSIPIYSFNNMNGISLPQFNQLINWFFSNTPDALSKTSNKSISNLKLYGKNEETVLQNFGFYLTEYSFISWLIE